ncbi:MAG TPA: condensation domain-containing protein [Pyrinomonadaceae bacterium]|nr:condensation domain-containing protein [Pyrinomonadaceae bacterium]
MSSNPKQNLDLNADEKRALMLEQLRVKARAPKSFPASFAQHRLWFLDQLSPDNPVYNIPLAMRLRGPLEVSALERTFTEIAKRHQSLRTYFGMVDGELQQIVGPPEKVTLPIVELTDVPESQREDAALTLVAEEGRRPFTLAQGPLMRVSLLKLDQDDHILLITMHHIISDGWSAGVFIKEMGVLYESFIKGEASPLPRLPNQYADYAVWQRKKLQGDAFERLLGYWRDHLSDAPSLLELPTDKPRPSVQSFRGSSYSFNLSTEIARGVRELSQSEGATMFMTLLAAFQALLARYSGQDDIVVGTPIANRNHVDMEGLIGFFVNTLALRGKLVNDPTFREFLQQLRATALEAYSHQEMPFEELVKDLQPERNLSYSPVFQVMFALQNVTRKPMKLSGIDIQSVKGRNTTAKFDVVMEVEESEQGLRVNLSYSSALFEPSTIERMGEHYRILLESILANPDLPVSRLRIVTEAERQQLLTWNDTARPYPAGATALSLFEARAHTQPNAVAVATDGQELTYNELNRRANQLASYLSGLGVSEESRVAILMEQSAESVIAMLGVLKAGAAYVPIEPQSTLEQLTFIVDDARISVLLTQKPLAGMVQGRVPHVIRLDADWESISAESNHQPILEGNLDNLVSILYRPGSRGQLVGTMITGRAALNGCLWSERSFGYNSESKALVGIPLSSESGLQSYLAPLIAGGSIVLAKAGAATDAYLHRIEDQKVTTLSLFAVHASAIVNADASNGYNSVAGVESMSITGDPRAVLKLRDWLKSENCNCRVINTYSLTECSGAISAYSTSKDEIDLLSGTLAGRPIDNTRLYVLDRHREFLPVGIAGELCVSGDVLARGYWNRPELTAKSFAPHPFISDEKIFLTGDRARFRADGQLEILGRLDPRQIRLHGLLIDLFEIESVLNTNEFIREATVMLREDVAGMERLVAYVVAHDETDTPTSSELHQYMRQRLPVFMVPSVFVTLDELPRTARGEINFQALPSPEALTSELIESFVEPRTPLEQKIASLLASVLGLERVGVNDNFFTLGGHSLLATQVISRMREEFRVALPVQQIFETPTVAGLAAAIEATQDVSEDHKIERVSLDEEELLLDRLDELSDEDITALLMKSSPTGTETVE